MDPKLLSRGSDSFPDKGSELSSWRGWTDGEGGVAVTAGIRDLSAAFQGAVQCFPSAASTYLQVSEKGVWSPSASSDDEIEVWEAEVAFLSSPGVQRMSGRTGD